MQLIDLFEEWQNDLSEFKALLKTQVKAKGQASVLARIKTVDEKTAAERVLTRSSYNARLREPQNCPLALVEQFADVLACPRLLALFKQQQDRINQLPDRLIQHIQSANIPNAFVIRKLGINEATFYNKLKNPRLWQRNELERIEQVIETLRKL